MNEKIKRLAQKVLSMVPNAPEKFGNIIAILMVISIMLTLIRIIQQCRKSRIKMCGSEKEKCSLYHAEIKDISLTRGWFAKRTIKRLLKKELTPEDYATYGVSIMNAILECGTKLTEDETLTLMEAANV